DVGAAGVVGLRGGRRGPLAGGVARLGAYAGLGEASGANNRATPPTAGSWPAVLEGFESAYERARDQRRSTT
ncbi:glycosyltransferase family 1 protein, partial [Nonomuraea wenchangensis]